MPDQAVPRQAHGATREIRNQPNPVAPRPAQARGSPPGPQRLRPQRRRGRRGRRRRGRRGRGRGRRRLRLAPRGPGPRVPDLQEALQHEEIPTPAPAAARGPELRVRHLQPQVLPQRQAQGALRQVLGEEPGPGAQVQHLRRHVREQRDPEGAQGQARDGGHLDGGGPDGDRAEARGQARGEVAEKEEDRHRRARVHRVQQAVHVEEGPAEAHTGLR